MKNMSRRSFMANSSRVAVGAALATSALGTATVGAAAEADAGVSSAAAANAVRHAATRRGAPYVYGASGPWRFDCSGLTMWSYRQVGKSLPRTANSQYRASRRISRGSARVGDLAFLTRGGTAYHAAIYAGNGHVWHAPHPGARVCLVPVSSAHRFGRV